VHEASLLRDLRRKLDELGRGDGIERIIRVRLKVGALSHVSPELLRERWRELVAGSPAGDAALEIESSADPAAPGAQDIVLTEVVVTERTSAVGSDSGRPARS
jgi:hydrogenase nickel incorporation protein HypA/HybF